MPRRVAQANPRIHVEGLADVDAIPKATADRRVDVAFRLRALRLDHRARNNGQFCAHVQTASPGKRKVVELEAGSRYGQGKARIAVKCLGHIQGEGPEVRPQSALVNADVHRAASQGVRQRIDFDVGFWTSLGGDRSPKKCQQQDGGANSIVHALTLGQQTRIENAHNCACLIQK